jgi:hypothetical protein
MADFAYAALQCCIAAFYLGAMSRKQEVPMLNRVKSFLAAFAPPSIEARERAYLNESVSRIDLERRERVIEQGMFRHRAFGM